jgi:hypothetical protein
MALLRTSINLPLSSISQKAVNSFNGFRRRRVKPLKFLLPGKRAFMYMVVLALSVLVGAITPWFLSPM